MNPDFLKKNFGPNLPFYKEFSDRCPNKDPANGMFLQMAEAMSGKRILKTHLPLSFFGDNLLNTCKVSSIKTYASQTN